MPESPDPFQQWQQYRDQMLDIWARNMAEYVGTDAFAKSLGDYLDNSLRTSGPFKDAFDQWAQASLAALNMPSRQEVLSIAERLNGLEMRLDDLEFAAATAPPPAQPAPADDTLKGELTAIREQLAALAEALRPAAAPASQAEQPAAKAAPRPAAKPAVKAAARPAAKPAARSTARTRKEASS